MPGSSESEIEERVVETAGVTGVAPATTCKVGAGVTTTGFTGAGREAGERESGCWQAIQHVASSGLAAPHSSQKNSSDDCIDSSLTSWKRDRHQSFNSFSGHTKTYAFGQECITFPPPIFPFSHIIDESLPEKQTGRAPDYDGGKGGRGAPFCGNCGSGRGGSERLERPEEEGGKFCSGPGGEGCLCPRGPVGPIGPEDAKPGMGTAGGAKLADGAPPNRTCDFSRSSSSIWARNSFTRAFSLLISRASLWAERVEKT